MNTVSNIVIHSWDILLESSIFMLLGILIAGLLKVFLSTDFIARNLGTGKYLSVLKAAFLGVPLPLCSCGVLPAAVGLKKQGANKGAVTAFLISTPESGIDSIAVTYGLLDPIMTVIRPVAAFVTAVTGGFVENFFTYRDDDKPCAELSKPFPQVSSCCDGGTAEKHTHARPFIGRIGDGLRYAVTDVWADIAVWFFTGVLLAGCITALVPDSFMEQWLGGGITSMLVMLVFGIPLYICASASTPIAAALILKGVSPGAALVFLLVGPATNITSLTVLLSTLGRASTIRYLLVVAILAVCFGVMVDGLYSMLNISPRAVIGVAQEVLPYSVELVGALVLIVMSIGPFAHFIRKKMGKKNKPQTFHSGFPV